MPDVTSGQVPLSHKLISASFMGLKLYVLLLILVAILFLLSVVTFLRLRTRNHRNRLLLKQNSGIIPLVSEEIKPAGDEKKKMVEILRGDRTEEVGILGVGGDRGSGSRMSDDGCSSSCGGGSKVSSASAGSSVVVEVQNIGWGRWYSLKELEYATCGFSDDNVIGQGGYGIVYRGVLEDGSVVAVKNLRKGQAEREFRVEVEAIGKVRHKNLVGLIGYCAEGAQRMLVYEYIDNGNLEQWLHGDSGPVSPLTWDIRMKIAIGTAKGLAYLHEGLEPKVVHRDVKSSNILLNRSWNPKVSDFGLAKLLGSEASYVTTRVMGTFGYVSPEYASTGMLSEGSDVYSFGVLLMELISGRSPIDYSKPAGEMNLVDWFKGMVSSRRGEEVLDPRIAVPPSSRALKRLLLICLRCVDMDTYKRPKMGQIIHMLEADEFPFRVDNRITREAAPPFPHPSGADRVKYPLKDVMVGGDSQRER